MIIGYVLFRILCSCLSSMSRRLLFPFPAIVVDTCAALRLHVCTLFPPTPLLFNFPPLQDPIYVTSFTPLLLLSHCLAPHQRVVFALNCSGTLVISISLLSTGK